MLGSDLDGAGSDAGRARVAAAAVRHGTVTVTDGSGPGDSEWQVLGLCLAGPGPSAVVVDGPRTGALAVLSVIDGCSEGTECITVHVSARRSPDASRCTDASEVSTVDAVT